MAVQDALNAAVNDLQTAQIRLERVLPQAENEGQVKVLSGAIQQLSTLMVTVEGALTTVAPEPEPEKQEEKPAEQPKAEESKGKQKGQK